MVTLIPKSFGPIYNFSTGSVGLCFLANGIGNIAGSLLAGYVSDTYYKRSVKDHNGEVVSEYRLKPIFFGVPLMVVGCVLYGWFLHAKLFWIGPLIVMAIGN